ncbi:prepilin peptidase [Sulfoacidibacillus thermotolerans]|uniref:Prepilin type IV endopeptidase peptidase domain-containing protein n=1 Tax=Sulfoacidibacillus thermotolerans TaxID=1765684 RepID=A0A2U3D5M3_SULT2|nr:prepilin peptidase [Sulfoacidibacillus thermotolerans]PWI56567.1 hypothetical protein BM613_13040 [Sulfoacidibacillus thermotolerans]
MDLFFALWAGLLFITFLAARQDMQTQTISNTLIFIGALFALFLHGVFQGAMSVLFMTASALAWLFIGGILWRANGIGGGDVKLFAMIATFTGFYGVVLIAMASFLAQFLCFLWQFSNGDMRLHRPFAPSIFVGTLVVGAWACFHLAKTLHVLPA